MKAPDKIYINNYNGNDTWGNQWHSKPSQSPSVVSHEYIRKDALLEWAKEIKEIMSLGGHVSIDDIISKIELL